MTHRTRRLLAVILTLAVAIILALATLLPMPAGGPPGSDKLHHLLGFAALTLPATVLVPRRALLILGLAVAYGGLIEIVQPWVGRHRELADWIADAAGAGIGSVLGLAAASWGARGFRRLRPGPLEGAGPQASRKSGP